MRTHPAGQEKSSVVRPQLTSCVAGSLKRHNANTTSAGKKCFQVEQLYSKVVDFFACFCLFFVVFSQPNQADVQSTKVVETKKVEHGRKAA